MIATTSSSSMTLAATTTTTTTTMTTMATACDYTLLDTSRYCRGGYYRGNCDVRHRKSCSLEDLAATASLNACQKRCDAEEECKFIAYRQNICSRYNSRAGNCSAWFGGGHTTMQKICQPMETTTMMITTTSSSSMTLAPTTTTLAVATTTTTTTTMTTMATACD